jgi:hypothetical protein
VLTEDHCLNFLRTQGSYYDYLVEYQDMLSKKFLYSSSLQFINEPYTIDYTLTEDINYGFANNIILYDTNGYKRQHIKVYPYLQKVQVEYYFSNGYYLTHCTVYNIADNTYITTF